MTDKELYRQKKQAKLDEWRAEVDKLKAKASGASADARLEMNKQIRALDTKIEEAKVKMSLLADASDDAWEEFKAGVESSWDSLKTAFKDSAAKFKE